MVGTEVSGGPLVQDSSGNVFRDLGLPRADEKLEIARLRRALGRIAHDMHTERECRVIAAAALEKGARSDMDAFHALLLAMVDARMGTDDLERGRELSALADACAAFEKAMWPMEED